MRAQPSKVGKYGDSGDDPLKVRCLRKMTGRCGELRSSGKSNVQ